MPTIPMSIGVAELSEYSNEMFEKHAIEAILEIFKTSGEVRPMAEVIATVSPANMKKSDKFFSMTILPHVNEIGFDKDVKEYIASFLRKMIHSFEAVAVAFISEGWMVKSDDLSRINKIMAPSEEPDRIEVVQIMLEFKQPSIRKLIFAEIKRSSENMSELGSWQILDGPSDGRFYGLFQSEMTN